MHGRRKGNLSIGRGQFFNILEKERKESYGARKKGGRHGIY
jgi:hypothetical protein